MGRASTRIAANAAPHLAPGEVVEGAFAAQPRTVFKIGDRYRVVVATPRRILVFESGTFSQTRVGRLVAELPRSTRLGPASGLWHRLPPALDGYQVNRRYHREIARIDQAD